MFTRSTSNSITPCQQYEGTHLVLILAPSRLAACLLLLLLRCVCGAGMARLSSLLFLTASLVAAAQEDASSSSSLRRSSDRPAVFDATLSQVEAANVAIYAAAANSSAEVVSADKMLGDFFAVGDAGQHPENFQSLGGNRFSLTVRPYQEAVRVASSRQYTGGRFEFRCKTASIMPGIITAVYLSSGQGRQGNFQGSSQDEIDLEWKGNTPDQLQSNIFVGGWDASQVTTVGFDTSSAETDYAIEWEDFQVAFYVNGNNVRRVTLPRPLRPMQLQLAVWTTIGGWSGLVQWAGSPDWSHSDSKEATAIFEILSVPNY